MYATPAIRNGEVLPVSMLCLDCGERLLYSHDHQHEHSDTWFRETSCPNGHTWMFAASKEPTDFGDDVIRGHFIDDSDPGWVMPPLPGSASGQ